MMNGGSRFFARRRRADVACVVGVLLALGVVVATTEVDAQKGLAPSADPAGEQKGQTQKGQAQKAPAANDLMGRWCGETTDYVFTRKDLTVTFHDDKSKRVLKITDIVLRDGAWLNVMWGKDSDTGFEFDSGKLIQRPNTSGDMGPRRVFRRC